MLNLIAFVLAVPSSIATMWVLSVLSAPKRVRGGVVVVAVVGVATGAQAALPAGFSESVTNLGLDIVSGLGLLMAAGLAYWLARRIYKDLLQMTSGR